MMNLVLMKHILKYLASGHQLETYVLLEFQPFNSKTPNGALSLVVTILTRDKIPLFFRTSSPLGRCLKNDIKKNSQV